MLVTYALIFGSLFALGVLPPHPGHEPHPARFVWTLFPVVLVAYVPMIGLYALFEAAVTHAALAVNRGGSSSFSQAYGAAWKRLGRVVWLMILRYLWIALPIALLLGAIALAIMVPVLGGKPNLDPGLLFVLLPLFLLGYGGSMIYGVWMALRLGLAVAACLMEEKSATESLQRSAQLTRGIKGRMALVMLVVYAIGAAAILVLEMAGFAGAAVVILIGSGLHVSPQQPIVAIGAWVLAVAVFAAFLLLAMLSWASYVITFAVFYDDQRLRLEGAVWGGVGA